MADSLLARKPTIDAPPLKVRARAFAKLEDERLIRRASPRLIEISDLAGLRRFLRNHARHARATGART